MAVFEIAGDDGTVYEVEAPTIEAAAKAVSAMSTPEKSWGQMLKENLLGDNDPTTHNFGEKVGSALNKAGESLTFGLVGDEASARAEAALGIGRPTVQDLVSGDNRSAYERRRDHYRQQEQVLEQNSPATALAADIGGAGVGVMLPFGAAGTLARGAGVGKRVAVSTATGAAGAGTYGFAEGEGIEDRVDQGWKSGLLGGGIGSVIPVVGGGVQRVADALVGRKATRTAAANAPTSEQLRQTGTELYNAIDDAGVQINAGAFDNARQKILQVLQDSTAYTPRPGGRTITPNTSAVVDNMADMSAEMVGQPGAALPFKELDSVRRQAGAAAGNVANTSDQKAGTTIIEGLDDFVHNLGADDIAAGDIEALKTALPKARDVWARMSRSQLLDDAMENAGNYVSGEASGLRNQFKRIVSSDKLKRGFSDAELKIMRRVANGTLPEQILNYMGSGLGMMGQMAIGGATSGFPGAIAGMATGAASRKGAEAIVRSNAELARAIVANGGMETLPVATDSVRKIAESLMRRGVAAGPQ